MPESARSRDGDGNFGGGRGLSADEVEEGPWSEGSYSGKEDSGSSSSSDDEETPKKQNIGGLKLCT